MVSTAGGTGEFLACESLSGHADKRTGTPERAGGEGGCQLPKLIGSSAGSRAFSVLVSLGCGYAHCVRTP